MNATETWLNKHQYSDVWTVSIKNYRVKVVAFSQKKESELPMSGCCFVETVGWVVFVVFAAKTIYNVIHFAYTTFLGRLLGRGIDLRSCGPWGGIPLIYNVYMWNRIIVIINF